MASKITFGIVLLVVLFTSGYGKNVPCELCPSPDLCPNKEIEVLNAMGSCNFAETECEKRGKGWRGLSIRDEADYQMLGQRLSDLLNSGEVWTSGKKRNDDSWFWASTKQNISAEMKRLTEFNPLPEATRFYFEKGSLQGIKGAGASEEQCYDRKYIVCERCIG